MNEASPAPASGTRAIADDLDDEPRGRWMRLTALSLVLLALGVALLVGVYDLHRVRTATMLPTLPVSGVGVYRAVDDGDVERGDIVRFRSDWPDAQGFPELTFRVLAVGGDKVSGARNGELAVNGDVLEEDYVDTTNTAVQPEFEVTVPAGRLFVAGDARSMAYDSRLRLDDGHDGTISVDSVSGRLVGVAWPVWHWSAPDSERGTPWAFVVASVLVGAGALIGLGCVGKAVATGGAAVRDAVARRRERRAAA